MFVTKYDPFSELNELRKGFKYMNALINSLEGTGEEAALNAFVPAVNSREDDKAYYVEVDLPGIKKEDIDINVEDNVLTISGERKVKEETKEEDYYKVESRYGKFSRSFTLPEKVDVDNIHAESKDGVLEVVIPKIEEKENKPKKIEVK